MGKKASMYAHLRGKYLERRQMLMEQSRCARALSITSTPLDEAKSQTFLRNKGVQRALAFVRKGTVPPGFKWKAWQPDRAKR
jgi:hypothetical protein